MNIWEKPPANSFADHNAYPLVNSPCGDDGLITVRTAAEGTLAFSEVQIGTTQLSSDGAIYVAGCQNIIVLLSSYTKGSSTALYIYPKFCQTRGGTYFRNIVNVWDIGGGFTLETAKYQSVVSDGTLGFANMFNPGLNWMKLFTLPVTALATSADISIIRGYTHPKANFGLQT